MSRAVSAVAAVVASDAENVGNGAEAAVVAPGNAERESGSKLKRKNKREKV